MEGIIARKASERIRLRVEVGVRYLLGTCWPNTYLLEKPLYIEVSALLR